jgi:hypothetical protein
MGGGNNSASRSLSHSRAAAPWHFGQCRLRQVMVSSPLPVMGKFRNGELTAGSTAILAAFRVILR